MKGTQGSQGPPGDEVLHLYSSTDFHPPKDRLGKLKNFVLGRMPDWSPDMPASGPVFMIQGIRRGTGIQWSDTVQIAR